MIIIIRIRMTILVNDNTCRVAIVFVPKQHGNMFPNVFQGEGLVHSCS